MRIMSNIPALNASNKLKMNNSKNSKVIEKLSSGLRINRAVDDAAGLAISEKMRAQIRGLEQASRNIQDGVSLIQTAEGGMNEIHSMLQRVNELTVQASSGILTASDRQLIHNEVNQIKDGINEIANHTEFNGINLLNKVGSTTTTTTSVISETPKTVSILSKGSVFYTEFQDNPTGPEIFGLGHIPGTTGDGRIVFTFEYPPSDPDYIYVPIGANLDETINNLESTFQSIKNGSTGTAKQQSTIASKNMDLKLYGNNVVFLADENMTSFHGGTGKGGHFFGKGTTATINYNDKTTIDITNSTTIPDNITLQIGANYGDTFLVELIDVRTESLNIDDIDLSTRQGAGLALTKIKDAISTVSLNRGKFGAYQNSLEQAQNNILNYSENLTAAESRIRDVDIAKGNE